jgi:glutamine---fructose-6-phosphate transaminase (isomerizing)
MPQSRIDSHMDREIRETPDIVGRQAPGQSGPLRDLVRRLRETPPQLAITCARGSSAHAATFGKHLIERHIGIPVAAAAPGIATIYHRQLRLDGQLFLAISQSGMSDDLVESAHAAKVSGAITAAIVNDAQSPLAAACEFVLPMAAGPELGVASTKTFVATLSTLMRVTALWAADGAMAGALERLPARLAAAAALDWRAPDIPAGLSLVTLGRGPTLAVACEAALKLKEVFNLHAEAFSGAEFQHGPIALVSARYPVLVFLPTDAAAPSLQELAARLRRKGAAVLCAEPGDPMPGRLPALAADHPAADAVCLIQSFYGMAVRWADRLGIDTDRPRHLQKVTRTR